MTEKDDWTKEEIDKEISSYSTAVTIPVNMRIKGQQRILDLTEMEKILRDAKTISLGECYCRKKYKKCNGPLDVCMSIDKEAEAFINKGSGRKINLSEAMEALERSHKAGLVHITFTFEGKETPEVICSCCSCCCHSMSALVRFGVPEAVTASKYISANNPETCINCGKCVQRCQFKARRLENGVMKFESAKCFGCGVCVTTCPTQSISLTDRTINQ